MHPAHNDKSPLRRGLLKRNTAKPSGFLILTHRMMERSGIRDALRKVLITNFKIIDTLNYNNKPIFQYFPVLTHYLKGAIFFLNSKR